MNADLEVPSLPASENWVDMLNVDVDVALDAVVHLDVARDVELVNEPGLTERRTTIDGRRRQTDRRTTTDNDRRRRTTKPDKDGQRRRT